MKILHVVRNLEIGGMERVVLALAAEQQRRGDTVVVAEVEPSAGERYAIPSGLEVRQTTHLSGLIRRHDCAVIHAHNLRALRFAWLPARLNRKRLVFTKHGMTFPLGISHWLCQRPDAIAAVSRPIYERYRQLSPRIADRLHVIPNGIATLTVPDRHTARKKLDLTEDATILLWVGRCVYEKGLDLLLDAFGRVQSDNIILLLVGDGPEREPLERQACKLGMAECVRFAGMQRDISLYYAAADVFVLPSRTEGLPMALLEAGMAGLPALVSDVGAMPEIIHDSGGGWIVRHDDVFSLRTCLHTVIQSRTDVLRRKAAALKQHVTTQYSVSKMAQLYDHLYFPVA